MEVDSDDEELNAMWLQRRRQKQQPQQEKKAMTTALQKQILQMQNKCTDADKYIDRNQSAQTQIHPAGDKAFNSRLKAYFTNSRLKEKKKTEQKFFEVVKSVKDSLEEVTNFEDLCAIAAAFTEVTTLPKTEEQKTGHMNTAVTKLQTLWRGHKVRACMHFKQNSATRYRPSAYLDKQYEERYKRYDEPPSIPGGTRLLQFLAFYGEEEVDELETALQDCIRKHTFKRQELPAASEKHLPIVSHLVLIGSKQSPAKANSNFYKTIQHAHGGTNSRVAVGWLATFEKLAPLHHMFTKGGVQTKWTATQQMLTEKDFIAGLYAGNLVQDLHKEEDKQACLQLLNYVLYMHCTNVAGREIYIKTVLKRGKAYRPYTQEEGNYIFGAICRCIQGSPDSLAAQTLISSLVSELDTRCRSYNKESLPAESGLSCMQWMAPATYAALSDGVIIDQWQLCTESDTWSPMLREWLCYFEFSSKITLHDATVDIYLLCFLRDMHTLSLEPFSEFQPFFKPDASAVTRHAQVMLALSCLAHRSEKQNEETDKRQQMRLVQMIILLSSHKKDNADILAKLMHWSGPLARQYRHLGRDATNNTVALVLDLLFDKNTNELSKEVARHLPRSPIYDWHPHIDRSAEASLQEQLSRILIPEFCNLGKQLIVHSSINPCLATDKVMQCLSEVLPKQVHRLKLSYWTELHKDNHKDLIEAFKELKRMLLATPDGSEGRNIYFGTAFRTSVVLNEDNVYCRSALHAHLPVEDAADIMHAGDIMDKFFIISVHDAQHTDTAISNPLLRAALLGKYKHHCMKIFLRNDTEDPDNTRVYLYLPPRASVTSFFERPKDISNTQLLVNELPLSLHALVMRKYDAWFSIINGNAEGVLPHIPPSQLNLVRTLLCGIRDPGSPLRQLSGEVLHMIIKCIWKELLKNSMTPLLKQQLLMEAVQTVAKERKSCQQRCRMQHLIAIATHAIAAENGAQPHLVYYFQSALAIVSTMDNCRLSAANPQLAKMVKRANLTNKFQEVKVRLQDSQGSVLLSIPLDPDAPWVPLYEQKLDDDAEGALDAVQDLELNCTEQKGLRYIHQYLSTGQVCTSKEMYEIVSLMDKALMPPTIIVRFLVSVHSKKSEREITELLGPANNPHIDSLVIKAEMGTLKPLKQDEIVQLVLQICAYPCKNLDFCTLCGKPLTDPTSRDRGLGRTCYDKLHIKVKKTKRPALDSY